MHCASDRQPTFTRTWLINAQLPNRKMPPGLKPAPFADFSSTVEAVRLHKTIYETSCSSILETGYRLIACLRTKAAFTLAICCVFPAIQPIAHGATPEGVKPPTAPMRSTPGAGSLTATGAVMVKETRDPLIAQLDPDEALSLAGTEVRRSKPRRTKRQSGPITVIGQFGKVIQNLKITSTTGDCLTITNSSLITVKNVEIGPCAGNGINITGGSAIRVYDSYIHVETTNATCCDHNDGIYAHGGVIDLNIQGNVIAFSETNVEVNTAVGVNIVGNFLLNPQDNPPTNTFYRGGNAQCWLCYMVTISNNYTLNSSSYPRFNPLNAGDNINVGHTANFNIAGNFVRGVFGPSACGLIGDTFTTMGTFQNNRVLDAGQCGIGVTDGNQVVTGNRVYNRTPVTGGGNTAIYAAHYGKSPVCGPTTVTNNIADEIRSNGVHSGWWTPGSCGAIDTSTDRFGTVADELLEPVDTVFAPPKIPPQPKNCVADSPFTNQTGARCKP